MLVLSRKENERLFIGDDIVITIVRVVGGAVKVGIEAPDDVQIQREEVRFHERNAPNKQLLRIA
jgi:carbon storage regulator